jgi:hypothetical protein
VHSESESPVRRMTCELVPPAPNRATIMYEVYLGPFAEMGIVLVGLV